MEGLDPCPCSRAMKRLRTSSSPLQESPPINKKKIVLIESPSSSSSMKDPTINTLSPPPANIHHSDQLQSNPFVRSVPDSSSFITTPAASPSLLQVSPSLLCTFNSVPFTSSSSENNVNSLASSNSPVSLLPFKRPCNSVTLENNNINNVNSLASNSPVSKSSLPSKRQCNSVPLTTSEKNSSSEIHNNHNLPAHSQPPFHPPPPDPRPHPNQPLPPLPENAPHPPAVWRICCIGATRIGTVTMMMIANFCPNVDITIVDEDLDVIHSAMQGEFTFYEPHLQQLNNHLIGLNPQRLRFTPDMEASILNAHMIFIAIEMKSKKGNMEFTDWVNVWKYLVRMPNMREKIIVDLTTLPLDFETIFRCAIDQNLDTYQVVLNPSFISEGRAVNDIHNPSRVVIATRSLAAAHALVNLYNQWVPLSSIYAIHNLHSAVIAKLGVSAIRASDVVSINTLNYMAELRGAERIQFSRMITKAYGIEDEFLEPGVGFGGGSDFEKCLNFLSDAACQKGLVTESRLFKQLLKALKRQGVL